MPATQPVPSLGHRPRLYFALDALANEYRLPRPAAHFVSLPQTTSQATPTGYHSSRSRRLPAKQILQAPIRPSSRSCRPFEQGQITGAPIGRRNRRQKHPAGYEADSDSARRNVYDEQFVRHRSSPAVLKIRRRASANFQDRPSCRRTALSEDENEPRTKRYFQDRPPCRSRSTIRR